MQPHTSLATKTARDERRTKYSEEQYYCRTFEMSKRLTERQACVVPTVCQGKVDHAAEPRLDKRNIPDRRGLEHVLFDPLRRVEKPHAGGVLGVCQSSQHLREHLVSARGETEGRGERRRHCFPSRGSEGYSMFMYHEVWAPLPSTNAFNTRNHHCVHRIFEEQRDRIFEEQRDQDEIHTCGTGMSENLLSKCAKYLPSVCRCSVK